MITFLIQITYFLIQSKWDPDPHHDGYVYAQALAASEGMVPNRDFFAMYGPLNPFLQGIWLNITNHNLISLRYFASLLLALTGVAIFVGTKNEIGRKYSFLLSLSWAIGNPLIHSPSLPWPNIILTLLLVSSIIIAKSDFKKFKYTFIYIGIILSLSILIRNYAIFSVLILFVTMYYWPSKNVKALRHLTYGSLITLIFVLVVFMKFKMTKSFVDQTIVYGFLKGHDSRDLRGLFNIRILAFGIIFMAFLLIYQKIINSIRDSRKEIVKISLFILITLTFAYSGHLQNNRNWNKGFSKNLIADCRLIMENLINLPLYVIPFIFIFVSISILQLRKKSEDSIDLAAYAIALSSIFQLFPSPHISKIWHIIPILLVGLAPYFNLYFGQNINFLRTAINYIIIPILISLLLVFYNQASVIRIPFKNDVLTGILGKPDQVESIDSTMILLKTKGKARDIEFRCVDGLFATSGNKYLAVDPYYVIAIPPFAHEHFSASQIFFCHVSKPYNQIFDSSQYNIIFETKSTYSNEFNLLIEKKLLSDN